MFYFCFELRTLKNGRFGQNGIIITPRKYSPVRLGVESDYFYRIIESSTLRGHP